jgi:hypothetical protein
MVFKSKLLVPLLVLSLAGTSCVVGHGGGGHDGKDEDQMPLDYVRYPYQAKYPGDDTGQWSASSLLCATEMFVLTILTLFRT